MSLIPRAFAILRSIFIDVSRRSPKPAVCASICLMHVCAIDRWVANRVDVGGRLCLCKTSVNKFFNDN